MPAVAQKATQQQTKTFNSQLVLQTIYELGQTSRADIARRTHLTRTTVSDLVTELQGRGLVTEIGYGPSVGGRSPILLSIVNDARHIISLDLANDEFRGAVVNLRNEVVQTASLPVASRHGPDAVAHVYSLIDRLLATTDQPILGIGIGTPGLVDTANGIVLRAVNLDWQDLPLGRLLQERYKLPIYLANDSQLAALAHYMASEEANLANLVVLTVGHGVGAGLILNGRLFQGDGFGAGEIGHVRVVEGGDLCRCGHYGCLETVVGTQAISRRAAALTGGDPAGVTVAAVQAACEAGDASACGLIAETGRYLGMAAASLIGILNIQRIVVIGPVAQFGERLRVAIEAEMRVRALPTLAQATTVTVAPYLPNSVIQGAAVLLLTRELGLKVAGESESR
ncbi:MAG: ROK family protein [Chloroflexota bacterium]|nr:ROK family protein [Chloroflexota bacterium]